MIWIYLQIKDYNTLQKAIFLNTVCVLCILRSDTFLASPVNEEAQALVYGGERAFSVNLIKALFKKFEAGKVEENIFISPSSIYHTLMLTYFGAQGATEAELAEGLGFGNLSKSEVLKTYMFDRAYQVQRTIWRKSM